MNADLTPRQQAVYDFIAARIRSEGAPSVAEIAQAFGIHDSAAHTHLRMLESKGALVLLPGRARGIRLPAAARRAARRDELLSLPILGQVAAGAPIDAQAGHDGQLLFDRAAFFPQPDYLLRVKGDSMRDDGILSGDLIAVHRIAVAENGQIVVALVDDSEVTLKRLRRRGQSIALEPANPAFKTQIYPADKVFVQGRLVGLLRKY